MNEARSDKMSQIRFAKPFLFFDQCQKHISLKKEKKSLKVCYLVMATDKNGIQGPVNSTFLIILPFSSI